jgi:replicative DNA helicase
LASHLAVLEDRQHGSFRGASTGLAELDHLLGGGLHDGGVVLIAGRPAVGKTLVALRMALTTARSKRPVLMFTPAADHVEVARRLLAIEGAVNLRRHAPVGTAVTFDDAQWAALGDTARQLGALALMTNDDARITPTKMEAIAIETLESHGDLGLIVIDSLDQVAATTNQRGAKLEQLMSDIKEVAVGRSVPIVVCSGLRVALEARRDKRPMLADLPGRIESQVDAAVLLYRDDYYNDPSTDPGVMELIVAKNRWGERGMVRLQVA